MAVLVTANYLVNLFNFTNGIGRKTYGDAFLAVAITLCAFFAQTDIFFALAILNVSLADGLAALVGKRYGKPWAYQVLGQKKTVIGTMTFWFVSLCVVAISLMFARDELHFNEYVGLIILMPPAMAALENFSFLGIDNLTVPLAAIAILRLIA
jgi:phytol kinase